MGRKRKGRPIHGWIVVDKPAGMTSATVVAKVRNSTGAAKVGHGGTLDPLATGVLPLALGEATKTVSFTMEGNKVYRFTVRWGEARATDDADGEVTAVSEKRPTEDEIKAVLSSFTGEIEQVPPAYSAVKVGGRRAYELARANRPAKLEPRPVRIESLVLAGVGAARDAQFLVNAGKGDDMRRLARDFAAALDTLGHVTALRRIAVGPFGEGAAISLDKLTALGHSAALSDHLLPVETALADIPALALTETEARRLRRGQPVPALPVASRSPFKNVVQGDLICAMAEGKLVALVRLTGGEIRPVRVLNL